MGLSACKSCRDLTAVNGATIEEAPAEKPHAAVGELIASERVTTPGDPELQRCSTEEITTLDPASEVQDDKLRSEPLLTHGPPEAQEAILRAGKSEDVVRAIEVLTAPVAANIRGCGVNPERAHLQALQNCLGWTIGGYDTRPTEAAVKLKESDRLQILLGYRQPEDSGRPPRVEMFDYLCDTIFSVPMREVGDDVVVRSYKDLEGNIITPTWLEADWELFHATRDGSEGRPAPVFAPNRYPYQLPPRPGKTALQQQAQHWILWYFRFAEEPVEDYADRIIDADVRRELQAVLDSEGISHADYIWYRNPFMSAPELFHVQVFWIVPQ